MIKISVMYPYKDGAIFDHEYYKNKHLPLLKEKMGDYCVRYSVDRGLSGAAPGSPPVYIASCHIYCESVESFYAGFGPSRKEILADVINYTDLTPEMQISEEG